MNLRVFYLTRRGLSDGYVSNEIGYVLYTRQNLLVQDTAPLAILAFSDRHLVGLG